MNVKALELKKWCSEEISPLAWSRIVLRVLPDLRDMGYNLDEIENPNEKLELGDKELSVIQNGLNQLYQMELPSEVINS